MKTNSCIDLHLHSHYSADGEYSVSALIQQCQQAGIQVMAIADHNSVAANKEALQAAKNAGITYIPAIEIDCTFHDHNFHMLGYNIDFENEAFQLIEYNIRKQALSVSRQMLLATQHLGFRIQEQDLHELHQNAYWKGCWTGEMFAEVLLNKPEYKDHPLLLPYREGGARADNPYVNFYWDYYAQGKPCYIHMTYPDLSFIVELIHRNHGYAILAHPANNLKQQDNLLTELMETGIDGIEAFSSYHNEAQAYFYYLQAQRHAMIITLGSDFHGMTKPAIAIGDHGCFLSQEEQYECISALLPV